MDGRFELVRAIGSGTYGEAFLARDLSTGTPVVVKVLRGEMARNAEALERFRREVRALERLRHPHVVELAGHGVCAARQRPYLAMRWSRGEPLDRVLAAKGRLDVSLAVTLVDQLLQALEAAAPMGIVHRDLKPDNLLVEDVDGPRPHLFVLDFGLAKQLLDDAAHDLTGTAVVGTPVYMAPEQCTHEPITSAADVYSVGCILMELVAGRPPFVADTPQALLAQHVIQPPPRLDELSPGIPVALADAVAACLAKAPADRPDATRLRALLREIDSGAARTGACVVEPTIELGTARTGAYAVEPTIELGTARTGAYAVEPTIELGGARTGANAVEPTIELGGVRTGAYVIEPTIELRPERASVPSALLGSWVVRASGPDLAAPTLVPTYAAPATVGFDQILPLPDAGAATIGFGRVLHPPADSPATTEFKTVLPLPGEGPATLSTGEAYSPSRRPAVAVQPGSSPDDAALLEPLPDTGLALRARLDASFDGRAGRLFLLVGTRLRLGRNRRGVGDRPNDLMLRAFPLPGESTNATAARTERLSGAHATLVVTTHGLAVQDDGSRAGTRIDGLQVPPQRLVPARDTFVLELGDLALRGHVHRDSTGALRAVSMVRLRDGEHHGYVLLRDHAELGSGPQDDVQLPHPGVAPGHARLVVRDGVFHICALRPDAPVTLDGLPLPTRLLHALAPGAELALGAARVRFSPATDDDMKP